MKKIVHKGHSSNFKSREFKDVAHNKKVIRHPMKKITSKKHIIYTQDSNKISLSCFDDNRYTKDDGINTLAFGHKDILKNELKKYIFLIYQNLKMVSMEYHKKTDNLINNIKNEKLKEKIENISTFISEFTDKKN